MRFYLLFFLFITRGHAAGCPEFETALQKAAARYEESVKVVAEKKAKKEAFSTPEVTRYKERYSKDFELPKNSNRDFMSQMKLDDKTKRSNVLYFDVENSIQKKLNDQVFGEKTMVDSVNNSFMERLYKNVKNNPELNSRLGGQYKDYKSLRLRLELKPGDDRAKFEEMLTSTYQKSATEFKTEFDTLNLKQYTNPRTDAVADVDRWFLAGTGDTPIGANMAARGARGAARDKGILHYQDHIPELHKDVVEIEGLRVAFTGEKHLLEMGAVEKLAGGQMIPTKDMINILRKIKPSDCKNDAEYLQKIHAQVKNIFGKDMTDKNIYDLTNYFKKVDSLSPPLFSRERIEIDLGQAEKGIVSIDFTGVGVDNAHQQMTALAKLNYQQTDKAALLKDAFGNVQTHVDQVTLQMNNSKKYFSDAVKKVANETHAPLFSGDDGIYMPRLDKWSYEEKKKLVQELGKADDPSKFRITFVESQYKNGKVITAEGRSSLIVQAEKFEKKLREKLIGVEGMSSEEAKKIITAIDFTPKESGGGTFKVLVGGKELSEKEKSLIQNIAEKIIDKKSGEKFGGMEVLDVH